MAAACVWQRWFAERRIAWLRMRYDSAAAEPTAEVARICVALGVAEPVARRLISGGAKRTDAAHAAWMLR
ncbi:Stf0 family sulfotransferase [Cypionkella sp. TWP1-2-1b2]|uniref:Stf0 family sulfotransferase n=1 Tax=Cypionkella sp. TWP1-2-1b2 TaxID=2804675 RepID=UPI003CF433B0